MRVYLPLVLLVACRAETASPETDQRKSPEPTDPSTPVTTPLATAATTPCDPRTLTTDSLTTLATPMIGRAADGTIFIVDRDPGASGDTSGEAPSRIFISHGNILERHVASGGGGAEDGASPFWSNLVDVGLPNGLALSQTRTPTTDWTLSVKGDGRNEALTMLDESAVAGFAVHDDAPDVLAFTSTQPNGERLFVFTPLAAGRFETPRIFYGPPAHISERKFGAFDQPLVNVTFDVEGAAMTLPIVITAPPPTTLEPALSFFCF